MSSKVRIAKLCQNDSARIYKWDVNIKSPFLTEGELINLRCVSVDVPNPTHTVIDINVRGFTKKESGAVEWNSISLTCIEVIEYTILQDLYALGNMQFDYETGVQHKKNDYSPSGSSQIEVIMESLDDSTVVTWQLMGCIIETYSPPQMTGDKGTAVEIPFTVHYDYAKLT